MHDASISFIARFRSSTIRRSRSHVLALAGLLGTVISLPAVLTGCNILGPISYAVAPEPKVDAQYELPDRPVVIFIDDRKNVVSPTSLRRVIADRASELLLQQEVVATVISSRDALAVASSQDRHGNLLSIDDIGESVGAEIVVYVQMLTFKASMDGMTPRPGAMAQLKVVDVANDRRLYPPADDEHDWVEIRSSPGDMPQELYRSRSTHRKIMETLALQLGTDIAEVFYEHRPVNTMGSRLDPNR